MKNREGIFNFGAGPACLPDEVLAQICEDIPDWYQGMSVMELSHRLPAFSSLTEKIEADLRALLNIPEEFAVLFMHGGARTQFSLIPLNLLDGAKSANYLITGHWSKLAFEDAKAYCQPQLVASSEMANYLSIPNEEEWQLNQQAPYFHYTDNETIQGVEFLQAPKKTNGWLVSDMTSNILTKPIDFSRYGLIYASAQKNLGIAGITLVLVRKTLLGKAHPFTPYPLNYESCYKAGSMSNTPPVFCWYVTGLVVAWGLAQGGLTALTTVCEQRAQLFYQLLDKSDFYSNPIEPECRSRVTIPFRLPTPELDLLFLKLAEEKGLKQLNGHKAVGGCRACFYNAMPISGVKALIDFMTDFEKIYG